MTTNYQRVTEACRYLLQFFRPTSRGSCARSSRTSGGAGASSTCSARTSGAISRPLAKTRSLIANLDAARCLRLMDVQWNDLFRRKLSREHRTWINELISTRNKWAHAGLVDMADEDAWRALDTMTRLVEQIDAQATERLRALARTVRYGTEGPSTTVGEVEAPRSPDTTQGAPAGVLATAPRQGLRPWREVARPHPDVAAGRYRQAEFAADLSQVARGQADAEYQDPIEFFARTYLTEGMRALMIQALRRITGQGGEPIIQLKTAFGGGKTHSLLALYHLLRGRAPPDRLQGATELLRDAGIEQPPPARVAVLVATIPESDIEIGGEAGRETLARIEHTFGRMEAIWKPVGSEEGFEVVRRRLFLPLDDEPARDDVCRAFAALYRENRGDFPVECREARYLERLKACYPIHPEVFERLYNDWATLERFQRTRGVLRLMAAVIHNLWARNDASLLILPCSVGLDTPTVRDELTRYLPEGWNPVLEGDVDGRNSGPFRIDSENPRFGQAVAARRVARTVFRGTVRLRLNEAWRWLLVPVQHLSDTGVGGLEWEIVQVGGGGNAIVAKASQRMRSSEHLICEWSPALLEMELDRWFWRSRGHVPVRQVWDAFCAYCYLPRLRDQSVFVASIQAGITSGEYFAYATSVSAHGRYEGMTLGAPGRRNLRRF